MSISGLERRVQVVGLGCVEVMGLDVRGDQHGVVHQDVHQDGPVGNI
jgi:hypothetical protein